MDNAKVPVFDIPLEEAPDVVPVVENSKSLWQAIRELFKPDEDEFWNEW